MATACDVSDLLTSQKRPGFIEKWPLSVAAVELILDTLDAWEGYVIGSEKVVYYFMLCCSRNYNENLCLALHCRKGMQIPYWKIQYCKRISVRCGQLLRKCSF